MTIVVDFYRHLDEQAETIITSNRNTSLTANYRLAKSNYKLRKSLSRPRVITQEVCASLMRTLGGVHRITLHGVSQRESASVVSWALRLKLQSYKRSRSRFYRTDDEGWANEKIYVPQSLRADTHRYVSSSKILNSKIGLRKNIPHLNYQSGFVRLSNNS